MAERPKEALQLQDYLMSANMIERERLHTAIGERALTLFDLNNINILVPNMRNKRLHAPYEIRVPPGTGIDVLKEKRGTRSQSYYMFKDEYCIGIDIHYILPRQYESSGKIDTWKGKYIIKPAFALTTKFEQIINAQTRKERKIAHKHWSETFPSTEDDRTHILLFMKELICSIPEEHIVLLKPGDKRRQKIYKWAFKDKENVIVDKPSKKNKF